MDRWTAPRRCVTATATVAALTIVGALAVPATTTASATTSARQVASASRGTLPSQAYRAHDYARGQAMSILPPGENGSITSTQLVQYLATGTPPPDSQAELAKYENLLYGSSSLTDKTLGSYYDDESFGVPKKDITRTEAPTSTQYPSGDVLIERDEADVPHIYGNTDESAAFGAGYAQAEDRLFLMDVLRHYGSGTLSNFIGPSCADEEMDHDQLLPSAATTSSTSRRRWSSMNANSTKPWPRSTHRSASSPRPTANSDPAAANGAPRRSRARRVLRGGSLLHWLQRSAAFPARGLS